MDIKCSLMDAPFVGAVTESVVVIGVSRFDGRRCPAGGLRRGTDVRLDGLEDKMKRKLKAVTDAIDALFSDTSVHASETLDALEDLRDDIESKIAALKDDIERDA